MSLDVPGSLTTDTFDASELFRPQRQVRTPHSRSEELAVPPFLVDDHVLRCRTDLSSLSLPACSLLYRLTHPRQVNIERQAEVRGHPYSFRAVPERLSSLLDPRARLSQVM